MTTRTPSDLAEKILEKLGVVPAGSAPQEEDVAQILLNLPTLFEELAGREIVYVGDPDNIPEVYFLSLAKIGAYEFRDEFGIQEQDAALLKIANDEAISNLKVITRGRPTYEPLKTVSF